MTDTEFGLTEIYRRSLIAPRRSGRRTIMEPHLQVQSKKDWMPPRLVVYGSVDQITQGCDKRYGGSDGFTFLGTPIQCAS